MKDHACENCYTRVIWNLCRCHDRSHFPLPWFNFCPVPMRSPFPFGISIPSAPLIQCTSFDVKWARVCVLFTRHNIELCRNGFMHSHSLSFPHNQFIFFPFRFPILWLFPFPSHSNVMEKIPTTSYVMGLIPIPIPFSCYIVSGPAYYESTCNLYERPSLWKLLYKSHLYVVPMSEPFPSRLCCSRAHFHVLIFAQFLCDPHSHHRKAR